MLETLLVLAVYRSHIKKKAVTLGWQVDGKWRSTLGIGDKAPSGSVRNVESKTDKRKQSLYSPESMLQEIKEEAARLDRSLSWVVQRAWKISRLEIKKLPSVNDVEGGDEDEGA